MNISIKQIIVKLLKTHSQLLRIREKLNSLILTQTPTSASTEQHECHATNERRQRYQNVKRNDDQNYSATPRDSTCRANSVTADN